ncbi:nucleoid-associated protein YgaU [Crossiella equi]|uniref:Nucleoid-associated protein YgaU n=1 Tax=Crossiella equi TaxID=130796 RepID=A0ABS5AEN6_9PSEU|nr:transglycosylase family protein [Crossiella equi]MBP2475035.1 nucleoid-associated protein YgaU [Crossiella equi]
MAGAVVAAPMAVAGTASAATMDWNALAQCESGNRVNTNTGNGYYGLYQFDRGTWLANGGGKYAPYAHQATREQQTEIAARLFAARGPQPWPSCGPKALRGGNAAKPAPQKAAKPAAKPKAAAPKPAANNTVIKPAAPVVTEKNGADYTVVAGDTLSTIAQKLEVNGGWKALFERNKDVVKDADLIFPGQKLDVK